MAGKPGFSCNFANRRVSALYDLSTTAPQGCEGILGVECSTVSVGNRGRGRPPEGHVPALALLARPAGQRDLEMQAVDVPGLLRRVCANLHSVWFQQVLGGRVIAMLILDAAIEREFVVRPHVQLERRHTGPFSVVDALGVGAIDLAAGLPVTLEECRSMVCERTEQLCLCNRRDPQATGHRNSCNQLPFRAAPGHLSTSCPIHCKSFAMPWPG